MGLVPSPIMDRRMRAELSKGYAEHSLHPVVEGLVALESQGRCTLEAVPLALIQHNNESLLQHSIDVGFQSNPFRLSEPSIQQGCIHVKNIADLF